MISIFFFDFLMCVLWPRCGLSWWMFNVKLIIMGILPLDKVLYQCQLDEIDWCCCSGQLYTYRFSPCLIYQLLREVSKSQTIIMDLSISPCSVISFCVLHFDTLLSKYTFMYSRRMNHFIMIFCPTLSLIIFLL